MGNAAGRRGVFYGWWVAVACGLLVFVGVGIGFYTPGIFLSTLHEERGWSVGALSVATTVLLFANGVAGVFVGRWIDRHSARRLFVVGALLMAAGVALIGVVDRLWLLFPVYILAALGMSTIANIPVNALLTRWFVRNRARAMAVTMSGVSLGGMVFVPLTVWAIDRFGLGPATLLLAAIVLLAVLPATLLVIRDSPADLGLGPDGGPPLPPPTRGAVASAWTPRTALRTTAFWLIAISFTFGIAGQSAFLIHQIAYLSEVIGRGTAATVLSLTAGASVVGRLALATVSDRWSKRWMAAGCFAVQAAAVLLVVQTGNLAVIALCTFAFGLTMGNSYILVSLLTAECFGVASFGAVYGLVSLFVMSGSALGPAVAGALAEASGGYAVPFTLTGGVTLLMALLVLAVRAPAERTMAGGRGERGRGFEEPALTPAPSPNAGRGAP